MRMHIIDMHNYCNIGMVDWFFPIPLITIPLAIGTCKEEACRWGVTIFAITF